MIELRFSTQAKLGAAIIRWATWSPYSHVAFVLPDGRLLSARGDGVAIRNPEPEMRVATFHVDAPDSVLDHARSQLGRPYDFRGIFGIGLRQRWQQNHAWFCSELVAWAFEKAGHPLLRTRDCWRITPRDLLLSPLLIPADVTPAQSGMGHHSRAG